MLEVGFPCSRCGVRSDVACKHRDASGPPREIVEPPQPKIYKPARYEGAGRNFRRVRSQ